MSRNVSALPGIDLFADLAADDELGARVVYRAYLPAAEPRHGELSPSLPSPLAAALAAAGVEQLWSHQVEGIEAARRGRDVLVTTPTASGKSLVFQLPVLEEAARGGPGRALFLFPLKALGQDQLGKWRALAAAAGLPPDIAGCEIYDGDTPVARRAAIRRAFPRVIVSNPDMVHHAVLGNWTTWGPFLADLKWIVLDELHTYRGIFGSHFHHVLERLLRLARSVGGNPTIIASSATAANAPEFAGALAGRSFHWVADSGAPREGRHFLLLRPEASPYTLALKLFVRCLAAGLKTIVFTKARRITELLYSWLRRQDPALAKRVASYRAGFLPEERRDIEGALFDGQLDGVISTSALEMGIDVGGLDACILVGYPGSMMATWQRSGRVGRAGRESVTALVAMPDALDQYFLDHPEEFLNRPCERLVVDPANEPVARAHLLCAAAELPLSREGDAAYLAHHSEAIGGLLARGHLLEASETGELFCLRKRPQRLVALRGTGETFAIVAEPSGRMIGTVDGVRAYHECHPGAVYLHAGRQYLVSALEREERRAKASAADLPYFTTPLTEKETAILEVLKERQDGPLTAGLARLKVTERVVGFERKQIGGQETLDQTPLDLPPVTFETVGLFFRVPREMEETLRRAGEGFPGAIHAAEHAAISLFPLLALCDRGDLGGISYPFHPQVGCGAVFVYDGHPGGVGIAARGFGDLPDLLRRVHALIDGCPCETGCPSCIQSPKCGNGNRPLDKGGAVRLLRLLLALEESVIPPVPPMPVGLPEEESEEGLLDDDPDALIDLDPPQPAARVLVPEPADENQAAAQDAATGSPSPARGRGDGGEVLLRAKGERRRRVPEVAATPVPQAPGPPARPARTALFDLETLRSASQVGGWGNAHRMGVAMGVVCFLEEGRFEAFPETRVHDLVAALRDATLVVGFNVKRFDYRVLAGYTGEDYNRTLPTFDLLDDLYQRYGFRVGLGHLAQETLGFTKSADGLQSLEWVRQGRLDLVESYCRRDVEVLRDLYLFGRREGYLHYRNKARDVKLKLRVEW